MIQWFKETGRICPCRDYNIVEECRSWNQDSDRATQFTSRGREVLEEVRFQYGPKGWKGVNKVRGQCYRQKERLQWGFRPAKARLAQGTGRSCWLECSTGWEQRVRLHLWPGPDARDHRGCVRSLDSILMRPHQRCLSGWPDIVRCSFPIDHCGSCVESGSEASTKDGGRVGVQAGGYCHSQGRGQWWLRCG